MPTIVPSQIRNFIDAEFKYIPRQNPPQSQILPLSPTITGSLRALLSLVDRLPNSLLPDDPTDFSDLISSLEAIRHAVVMAEGRGAVDLAKVGEVKLIPGVRPGGWNPVLVVREILEKCPDDLAVAGSKELPFVKDPAIRSELLSACLASPEVLTKRGESTVRAGSYAP